MDLVQQIASECDFTLVHSEPLDRQWGVQVDSTLEWNGITGELARYVLNSFLHAHTGTQ